MSAEAISLEVSGDGERGRYAFTCPDCSADVTRAADRRVVALLLAAGVATAPGDEVEPGPPDRPLLPPEDRNPRPDAPAFTLDDLIDLHFLLEDAAWLAEEATAGRPGGTVG
jgi:hypothetical protein